MKATISNPADLVGEAERLKARIVAGVQTARTVALASDDAETIDTAARQLAGLACELGYARAAVEVAWRDLTDRSILLSSERP